jgi:hypothetical protein
MPMKLIDWWRKATVPGYTRWAYLAPALVSFLIVGHALEDAGWQGAIPYGILLLVSLMQLVRPTVIGWFICILPFIVFLCLLLIVAPRNAIIDWRESLLIGVIPTLALLWAHPRIVKTKRSFLDQNGRGLGGDAV